MSTDTSTKPIRPVLLTSLAEIRSFNPCYSGWKTILAARKPQCDEDYNIQFPLVDCVESNSIADVCWLIGKRKVEIDICVKFARMCANSVTEYENKYAAVFAASAAAYAAVCADYADAAVFAASAAAYAYAAAAGAAYAASAKQKAINKQFLIDCINNF